MHEHEFHIREDCVRLRDKRRKVKYNLISNPE